MVGACILLIFSLVLLLLAIVAFFLHRSKETKVNMDFNNKENISSSFSNNNDSSNIQIMMSINPFVPLWHVQNTEQNGL